MKALTLVSQFVALGFSALVFSPPLSTVAQSFTDADWSAIAPLPVVNGSVFSSGVDTNGNLYICGNFTIGAPVFATNVAEWNGVSWSALGSGMQGGAAEALAISGTNVYVAGGGYFQTSGGAVNYIAQWNGSSWSALDSGVDAVINTLAVYGTNLIAAGTFTIAGGGTVDRIAQWNGSTWSSLGTGLTGPGSSGSGPDVFSLAVSGTNLYVGGQFSAAGGISATNIACWNGSSWSALGSGISGGEFSGVYSLAAVGPNVYAGGSFSSAGGGSVVNVAQWNGTTWSAMGSGLSGAVEALVPLGTTIVAGGNFNVGGFPPNSLAVWNGSSWSALGGGGANNSAYVFTLAVSSGGHLYAGGNFLSMAGVPVSRLAHWNGSLWSGMLAGMDLSVTNNGAANVGALAVSGTNLYIGGSFNGGGGVPGNYVARWNGVSCTPLGSGMNGPVSALAVIGTNLYAGGAFTTAGGVPANNIAQWNGSSWSPMGAGLNNVVLALAVMGTNLYAAGNFTPGYIAQWNGTSWSSLAGGMNAMVSALAVLGTNLFAGGGFTTAGGTAVSDIAQWNGSSWSGLGSPPNNGVNNVVTALAATGTNLYVGGFFTTAGTVPASAVALWNGNSWSALGSGITGMGSEGYGPQVYALAARGDTVYVGGEFSDAGGGFAYHIAQCTGTNNWSAMGSSVNARVMALDLSGPNLFVGGFFTQAGPIAADGIALAQVGVPTVVITNNSDFGFTNHSPQFGFDIVAEPNLTLIVQASTNMLNWVPLQTNVLSGPIWYYNDPNASSFRRRFYRALMGQ